MFVNELCIASVLAQYSVLDVLKQERENDIQPDDFFINKSDGKRRNTIGHLDQ